MSVNKVILVGNVGGDPEMRHVGERLIAEFRLATNERAYTTASGTQIPERTEWHRIVMLSVEGKLRTRVWEDRNTIKHTVTEVYADFFDILSRPVQS